MIIIYVTKRCTFFVGLTSHLATNVVVVPHINLFSFFFIDYLLYFAAEYCSKILLTAHLSEASSNQHQVIKALFHSVKNCFSGVFGEMKFVKMGDSVTLNSGLTEMMVDYLNP